MEKPNNATTVSNEIEKSTQTTCPYCGVGCQMKLITKGNQVIKVEPVTEAVNKGLLCAKGRQGYHFINHEDRLTTPLLKVNGEFKPISWEEAYDVFKDRFTAIKETSGGDAIGMLSSAKMSVEENYLAQKFARTVFGTNNIDHCARLCHATSVTALYIVLGSGAMTNPIEDLEDTDTMFIIGANPTEAHPVIGTQVTKAKKEKSFNIIVADPRKTTLAKSAEVYLAHTSGSDIALVNAMIYHIIKNDLYNKEFIEERTEGFEDLLKVIDNYQPEKVADLVGVSAEDIKAAAELYAKGPRSSIVFGMGIAQHANGVDTVCALANLALICGMMGRPGTGINPLRGQSNVQGACDTGNLPIFLPGYQLVSDESVRAKFEKVWGIKVPEGGTSFTVSEMKNQANGIKGMYIIGENPVNSSPESDVVVETFKNLDFMVVQDIFLTETAVLADLVLPASSYAEKLGTFTSTERRVQLIRPAIEPVGDSKPDYIILQELMNKMGVETPILEPEEIMQEFGSLVPQYSGVTYDKIARTSGCIWPIKPEDEHGVKVLHQETFPIGKAIIKPVEYSAPKDEINEEYPVILTTGRISSQFHGMSMSGKSAILNKVASEGYAEIHPEDASKLNIEDGEQFKIISRRGFVLTKAKITPNIKEGIIFVPFHFMDTHINRIVSPYYDPVAKEPELKVTAVRLEKLV